MQYLARGYQAFVVYYSIAPSRFPAALKDAAKSMDIIRSNAVQWGIEPNSIVICGFSAGGQDVYKRQGSRGCTAIGMLRIRLAVRCWRDDILNGWWDALRM